MLETLAVGCEPDDETVAHAPSVSNATRSTGVFPSRESINGFSPLHQRLKRPTMIRIQRHRCLSTTIPINLYRTISLNVPNNRYSESPEFCGRDAVPLSKGSGKAASIRKTQLFRNVRNCLAFAQPILRLLVEDFRA